MIEILLNHLKHKLKAKADQGMFDLSHGLAKSFHTKSVSPSLCCVDIGAPRSCIVLSQYKRILHSLKRRTKPLHTSNCTLRFGYQIVKSFGMEKLALYIPSDVQPIPVIIDIVPVNDPVLLELDVLDGYSMLAENATHRLWHSEEACEDP